MTQKNQKIAQTPHILGRFNACENSVYQALPFFTHTPGQGYAWRYVLLNPFKEKREV